MCMNNYKEFEWLEFSNHIRNIFSEHVGPSIKEIYKNSVGMVTLSPETKELTRLKEKFDFLSNDMLMFTQLPVTRSYIHIDNKPGVFGREFAFNVGIKGISKLGCTEFFQPKVEDQFIVTNGDKDPSFGSVIFKESECDKIDEYCLLEYPILINTRIPHRVNNKSNDIRMSLSWTINPMLSWEQALERIEYHRIHTQFK